jgi:hypothetical protein
MAEMTHAQARAEFEREILQLRNMTVSRRCARLLGTIDREGGVITDRDMRRLYGHIDGADQRLVAFAVDMLLSEQQPD